MTSTDEVIRELSRELLEAETNRLPVVPLSERSIHISHKTRLTAFNLQHRRPRHAWAVSSSVQRWDIQAGRLNSNLASTSRYSGS